MRQCVDCGQRTSQPVLYFETAELGVVVTDGEAVCRECLEKRKELAARQIDLFEEVEL
jgi:hypothetical protein